MTLKLTDFPGYVAEGQKILSRLKHFFVDGAGNVNIDTPERFSILLKILKKLKPGIESCLLYPAPGDTETKKSLIENANVTNKRNQLFFNGSIKDLVNLLETYTDKESNNLCFSTLFDLNRNKVNWPDLFSSLYDPGFLENPRSVVSPSAYNYAKKKASNEHVIFIIFAPAYFFPSFLVFGQTDKFDLFTDYAMKYCNISERFRNLYSHYSEKTL